MLTIYASTPILNPNRHFLSWCGEKPPPPVPPGCSPILTTINLELPLQLLGNQSKEFFHFLRILHHLFLLNIYFQDMIFSSNLTATYWYTLAPQFENCTELFKFKGSNCKTKLNYLCWIFTFYYLKKNTIFYDIESNSFAT